MCVLFFFWFLVFCFYFPLLRVFFYFFFAKFAHFKNVNCNLNIYLLLFAVFARILIDYIFCVKNLVFCFVCKFLI